MPLYELLLEKGILIRDCSNFRGLQKGFYRIAIKSREENGILLKAIQIYRASEEEKLIRWVGNYNPVRF